MEAQEPIIIAPEHSSLSKDLDFAESFHSSTNYLFLPVISKVNCIRRKRGQIICLQTNK